MFLASLLFAGVCAADEPTPQQISAELQSGRFDDALKDSASLLAAHPNDPMAETLHGLAQRGVGSWKEALESFDKALAKAPSFPPALKAASETAYLNKDPRAIGYLHRLLLLQPGNAVANAMAGALAYERGDCSTSVRHFARSGATLFHSEIAASQDSACLLKLHRPSEAVAVLQQAAAADPANKTLQYNLAVAQLLNGQPGDSVTTMKSLTAWSDPNADELNLLASAQAAAGDGEGSVASLRKAIELTPAQEDNYLDLATMSLEHDSPTPALEVADAGIHNVARPSYRLYAVRGMAQAELSHYDEAQSDFSKSLELQPGNPGAIAGKSLYYTHSDQPEKAVQLLREKLRASPDDPILNYLYADALARTGPEVAAPQFKEALRALERSLKAKPNYVEALALQGKLYIKADQLQEASRVLQQAVRDDPGNRAAMNQLLLVFRKLGKREEAAKIAERLTALLNQDRKNQEKVRVNEPE
ncbi:MAG: tetratricopeptide repeat protein [Candidatus Acidiferrum sp.]